MKNKILSVPVNFKNIAVIGFSSNAGSTFFTMNFASYLSNFLKTAIIEHPSINPYLYYYLGLNALCGENLISYTSHAHKINEGQFLNENFYVHKNNKNLYWLILDATLRDIEDWNNEKFMRLLCMPKPSLINIVDFGDKFFTSKSESLIEQFSTVFVIIDPMIPNLLKNHKTLSKLKELESNSKRDFIYIINKYTKGIETSTLIDFLEVKKAYCLPFIDFKYVYKAVYNGDIPINYASVKNILVDTFDILAKELIPKELLKKEKRKLFN